MWLYRLHKEDDRIRALALTEEVGQGEGDIRAGFHCFALKRGRCFIVFLAIAIALAICTFVDDCFYTPPDTHSVTPHLRFYDSLLHLPCVTELVGFLSCFRFGQAFTCTRYTRFVDRVLFILFVYMAELYKFFALINLVLWTVMEDVETAVTFMGFRDWICRESAINRIILLSLLLFVLNATAGAL